MPHYYHFLLQKKKDKKKKEASTKKVLVYNKPTKSGEKKGEQTEKINTVPLKNCATTAKHQTPSTLPGGVGGTKPLGGLSHRHQEPLVTSRQTPRAVSG